MVHFMCLSDFKAVCVYVLPRVCVAPFFLKSMHSCTWGEHLWVMLLGSELPSRPAACFPAPLHNFLRGQPFFSVLDGV